MKDFAERYGPWAVIAGASEGLGAAFARTVAARGVNVVLLARRQAALDDVAAEAKTLGVEARTVACDLADASFVGGSGLAEALAAGAEQVIVVSATPQSASPSPRRRGPRALANGILATLERQAVEQDLAQAERLNRIVETVGHRSEDGGHA